MPDSIVKRQNLVEHPVAKEMPKIDSLPNPQQRLRHSPQWIHPGTHAEA
jgi:hypothetical protein